MDYVKKCQNCIMGLICLAVNILWPGYAFGATESEVTTAAYSSLAAYEGQWTDLPGKELTSKGYTVRHFKVAKNNTLLISSGKNYILAIAGTESKTGLLHNLQTKLIPFDFTAIGDNPKLHEGYAELASAYVNSQDVQYLLAKIKSDSKAKLIITGHSLGGAVAVVLAMEIYTNGLLSPSQLEVITFGAPTMGNKDFLTRSQALSWSAYQFTADIVPDLFHWFRAQYSTDLPNSIVWQNSAPAKAIDHSMIFYVEEAQRQLELKNREALPKTVAEAELVVGYPYFINRADLSPDVSVALQQSIGERVVAELGKGKSYLAPAGLTLEDTLQKARETGAKHVLWTTVMGTTKFEGNVKGDYYLSLRITLYDARTGNVKNEVYYTGNEGKYTMLPKATYITGQLIKGLMGNA